jgi:hypothetical protein
LNVEYDEGEHVKELFAYFGRAFYMANVLEEGLALSILQLDFLSPIRDEFRRTGRQGFDRAKFEADFDAFMHQQHALTFGNLLRNIQNQPEFDDALKARIAEAKGLRDFLGHHFWRERSLDFARREGRDAMIAEVQAAAELFEGVNDAVDEAMKPVWTSLGFTEEMREAYFQETMAAIKAGHEPPT